MKMKTLFFLVFVTLFVSSVFPQTDDSVVVQPGSPGKPTKILPDSTQAKMSPVSKQDVEFMQGMIMHHAQAVEMTALIAERTTHKGIRSLGDRISLTQAEEIKFMERWLKIRGYKTTMSGMGHKGHKGHNMKDGMKMGNSEMSMPGMLSPAQMKALRDSKGIEFDELFLKGMIQHHIGALVMVKDLFDSPGSGQDAELFTFATDVDSTQRAEIKIMQTMLEKNP